ncbi:esterase-like activity of phytase family protein [Pelomonas sp. Root1237]|uniref:esterase-like activity of phytase family protein n=1 Tax=Pelomonas sp. Root1237 TaxID=1736434 RepID=UPI0006F53E49|nr:esterase-like activity of phytase family protein [Pelomonas sp. Root1237]KQV87588.1 pyruvate-binding protein [Pelomonas sp. Root1237]
MRLFLTTAIASALLALAAPSRAAEPVLIGMGNLSGSLSDLSGLNYSLESGLAANLLGGMGSGLAWAGGNTFLALPDRGPNANDWGAPQLDNTTSFIARFQTVQLSLTANAAGSALPYTLTPTLQATTLLSSSTTLNYGPKAATLSGIVDSSTVLAGSKNYFSGRSDNFASGLSTNPANARLDPEGIRVSNDGKSVFISDEYGPYVYQFDRATGERIRTFSLPSSFAVGNVSSSGAAEISGNTAGRVANKGMEGLAISPDGKTLFGFVQSPLAQDGGDGGRYNRIVKIDVATGATSQFAFDNQINGKAYNSSELLALNDHELIVLERDGKGMGDGSKAAVKQLVKIDLTGAAEVSGIADLRTQPGTAIVGTRFLDIKAALNAAGISDALIPAKLEGIAFGEDVIVNGKTMHTLYLANDNDFLATAIPNGGSAPAAYGNQFYVFAFEGNLTNQAIAAVPEPSQYALLLAGLSLVGFVARRRSR